MLPVWAACKQVTHNFPVMPEYLHRLNTEQPLVIHLLTYICAATEWLCMGKYKKLST